jgi:hypothetical protein
MSRLSETRSRFYSPNRRCRPRLELLEDRWVPSAVRQFDFGKAGSPVRPGYTEVTESSSYDETTGYGWLPGASRLESRDRGIPGEPTRDALTRDFVLTRDGTFAIDLPNGIHSVTLTSGDVYAVHGLFIYLEGTQVDAFQTEVDKYATRSYVVNLQDGRLEVRLKEQNNCIDDNAVINLLEIDTWVDPVFDRHLTEREPVKIALIPHSTGVGAGLEYRLLSPVPGAVIDARSGDFTWTPQQNFTDFGSHLFRVQVTHTAYPARTEVREFSVSLQNDLPKLIISGPQAPGAVGDLQTFTVDFDSSQPLTGYKALVDFGDGFTELETINPTTGDFAVNHIYSHQKNFTFSVLVMDQSGHAVTTNAISVHILPKGTAGKIHQMDTATIQPGGEANVSALDDNGNPVMAHFTHYGTEQTNVELFLVTYTESPVPTKRPGPFFDVQVSDGTTSHTGELELMLKASTFLRNGKFELGYFTPDEVQRWVPLVDPKNPFAKNNPLCEVSPVDANGFIKVKIYLDKVPLHGTVFTVGLPPSGDTATVTIRPAQASASTDSSGQTRSVSFSSNAQLSLALTASRDNQLSVSSTARGSQAGESSGANTAGAKTVTGLTSTAGVGGSHSDNKPEEFGKEDGSSFWRWLQSDEGLMELWQHGIEPAVLMKQLGVGAEASDAPLPSTVFETSMTNWSDEADHAEMAQVETNDGEPADAPFIGLAFLPVLLAGQAPRRRKAHGHREE